MIERLENACYLLDTCPAQECCTLNTLIDRTDQLKNEKICAQQSIIELQQKLIEQKTSDLKIFRTVVQSDFQSYSTAVSKTCTVALAPKRIELFRKNIETETSAYTEI